MFDLRVLYLLLRNDACLTYHSNDDYFSVNTFELAQYLKHCRCLTRVDNKYAYFFIDELSSYSSYLTVL